MPGTTSTCTPAAWQNGELLAAAAEDVRVAALEPHDVLAVAGELHEQGVDRVLRHRVVAGELADVDDLGVEHPRPIQDAPRAEPVGDDDVGVLQGAQAAHGEQVGVAGTGADERDEPAPVLWSQLQPVERSSRTPDCSRPRPRSIRRSSGPKKTSSMRMPIARITRIVPSTPARSASVRDCSSIEPRPKPIVPPRRDDLGGHERAPRERPALLEAGDVAGEGRGEDHEGRELEAAGAEHRADPAQLRRHLVDARDETVDDRRDRAHQDDEVDGGIREAEPDDRRRHPRDRGQHLQSRDDRARSPRRSGFTSASSSPSGVPTAIAMRKPMMPRSRLVVIASCSRPDSHASPRASATSTGLGARSGRGWAIIDVQLPDDDQHRRRRSAAAGRSS